MILYSHTEVNQFKIRNQMQCSHSKRGTQCMFSPIGLPLFSNQLSIRLTQDQKGLSKACNGDECKGMVI
uniref:Putative ovule protein n=1 Tax=Solanum chacoense TaxID=4108 RepID=A0A0V0GL24_SOLCH